MPSLMDRIQAKLELLRLEKRYTRSRHRRSAFVSNAVYIDGEYVFQQTPSSTGSSTASSSHASMNSHGIDALHGDKARPMVDSIPEEDDARDQEKTTKERKRLNRFSSMPTPSARDETAEETKQRKKLNRFSSMPGFGGSYAENSKAPRLSERRLSMIR